MINVDPEKDPENPVQKRRKNHFFLKTM